MRGGFGPDGVSVAWSMASALEVLFDLGAGDLPSPPPPDIGEVPVRGWMGIAVASAQYLEPRRNHGLVGDFRIPLGP